MADEQDMKAGGDVDASALDQTWLHRSALLEMLSLSFAYPRERLSEAVVSGEFASALLELVGINGLTEKVASELGASSARREAGAIMRAGYQGMTAEKVEEVLAAEYTRLFVGAPDAPIPPYEYDWTVDDSADADDMAVGKNAHACEAEVVRCYREAGLNLPKGTGEPLDHIATELEFLQYLSRIKANVAAPDGAVHVAEDAYERFLTEHLDRWASTFGSEVMRLTHEPFYRMAAAVLAAIAS